MKKTLIIIPAYNESGHINNLIKEIRKYVGQKDILIIDDGSSDHTNESIRIQRNLLVIRHSSNLGYGAALQTGFKYAVLNNYNYIIQMDADGQHKPEFIPIILRYVQRDNNDIVIGSRFLKSSPGYSIPFLRRLGMIIFSGIVSLIIRQKITDPTSGFRVVNNRVAKFYASEVYPTDFPDADVIIMLKFAGAKIKEVPVTMRASLKSTSTHDGVKPIYYMFKMFFSIFLTLIRIKKQL